MLSPAGPAAQPEKSARRLQQQERVGVNGGSTEAREDRAEAAVWTFFFDCCERDATVVRTSARVRLYAVTVRSRRSFREKPFLSFQHHQVHACCRTDPYKPLHSLCFSNGDELLMSY